MGENNKPIGEIMVEASNLIVQIMKNEEATVGDKVKAFGSLVDYYRAAQKQGGNGEDSDDGQKIPQFSDLRKSIRAADGEPDGQPQ